MSDDINKKSKKSYKEMPRNLDAERNFLGALILDGSLLTKVTDTFGTLDENEFSSDMHQIVFHQIMQRSAFTEDFNVVSLVADLEKEGLLDKAGGMEQVASLTEMTGPTAAIVEYATIIRDMARRRNLIKVAEQLEQYCYSPDGMSVDEIYDAAQGLVFSLVNKNMAVNAGPKSMIEVAKGLIEKIQTEKDLNRKLRGVATGFNRLDELTSGLQGGSLNIVAARPGVGKTSFAMNVVSNIAMNRDNPHPALVFSLEMPAEQIAMRLLSSFGRVPMKDLASGNANQTQWQDIITKLKLLTQEGPDGKPVSKLFIDDTSDVVLTPLELRSRAKKIAAEYGGLSVIMVDYIQLMKSQTKLENRSLEVGEISRSLKQLAKELDVPIIALSQLNREVEGRKDHRPLNSDLRESGSLEQDADMILFIDRESLYKTGDTDESKATLIVSKNRNGATEDIELQFQGKYTTFYNKDDHISAMDDVPPIEEIVQ